MDSPRIRTPKGDPAQTRRILAAAILPRRSERRIWLESALLRPGQVADLFQVSRRTVAAWAAEGLLASITTPGGHRRFRAADIHALVELLTVTPVIAK